MLMILAHSIFAQGYGIIRKNYISIVFDSLTNSNIEVLDSSTIRLGTIDGVTGNATNLGSYEYKMAINIASATINPYLNHYMMSSGSNLLTFDMADGKLINAAPINGPLLSSSFQNYRFNTSDSTIYGLIPNNFYSSYFDSTIMDFIEVLDSQQIRFAKINPSTGEYSLIGNTSQKGFYQLAGNSIDPYQMLYYYSAVDTLVSIDLYTGEIFSEVKIQLPQNTIFENFTYSCIDTAIYGLARENFFSSVYDSSLQDFVDVFDSLTIKLCKIDPSNGAVNIISPNNIGLYSLLTSRCFIDPNTMTYYFNTGSKIVGVSLATGLITSNNQITFEDGGMYIHMMLNSQNCFGAQRMRENILSVLTAKELSLENEFKISPNPAKGILHVTSTKNINQVKILDLNGKVHLLSKENKVDVSSLPFGIYLVLGYAEDGWVQSAKMVKN